MEKFKKKKQTILYKGVTAAWLPEWQDFSCQYIKVFLKILYSLIVYKRMHYFLDFRLTVEYRDWLS